jgi:hypothetical protein
MPAELEAGLWVLLSLVARPLEALVWSRLQAKAGEWSEALEQVAPWLHAVGPMYLALMTGAVLGSRLGLYGFGLQGSLLGGLGGALILAGLFAFRRFGSERIKLPNPPDFDTTLRDELRWGFYRGAAAGWLGQMWLGGLAGFGLATVEWMLAMQPWSSPSWKEPIHWAAPVRAGLSAILYSLSGNLWLILAVQLLAVMVWRLELTVHAADTGEQE